MYEVFISRKARRSIRKLAAKERPRMFEAIKLLGENPRPTGCKKIRGAERTWRIRVGDYRILYDIEDQVRVVTIEQVVHRKDAY